MFLHELKNDYKWRYFQRNRFEMHPLKYLVHTQARQELAKKFSEEFGSIALKHTLTVFKCLIS